MSVLLAYAHSAPGAAAAAFAVEEARRRDAELIVFPLDGSTPEASELDYPRTRVELPAERSRDAADELVEAAARLGVELIVVGMRRRSPAGKVLLGSDAQRIILDAPVPVTSVRVH